MSNIIAFPVAPAPQAAPAASPAGHQLWLEILRSLETVAEMFNLPMRDVTGMLEEVAAEAAEAALAVAES